MSLLLQTAECSDQESDDPVPLFTTDEIVTITGGVLAQGLPNTATPGWNRSVLSFP